LIPELFSNGYTGGPPTSFRNVVNVHCFFFERFCNSKAAGKDKLRCLVWKAQLSIKEGEIDEAIAASDKQGSVAKCNQICFS
jgi:biopolymer transport protein ExbB